MNSKNFGGVALICIAAFISGCSSIKTYPNTLTKNLQVMTQADSVETTLDVYAINDQCKVTYQGTVQLDQSLIQVGVPADRPSYLVVGFASSSFLGSSRGFISHDTLLNPRKGNRYELEARYVDDIYNVTLYEVNVRTTQRREVERVDLQACRSR